MFVLRWIYTSGGFFQIFFLLNISMYTTERENEYWENKNIQLPVSLQIFKRSDISVHEETKEIGFSKTEETKAQINKSYCPPQGTLNKYITNGVLLIMIWCAIWSISGLPHLPDENLFGLFVIFCSALIGGKLLEFIKIPSVPPLPSLLGNLLAGFTIRNIPFLNDYIKISSMWSSTLRNIALTLILLKAGFGLDPEALKRLKSVCLRLSMGPCFMEACSTAVISHFIMNFPWQWGFLLGFVVGAVSPAIVVPSMICLQENGYGIEKGIPTLLMAASSLDDIVAITGFSTCMGIVFSSGDILHNLLISFRDIFIGLLLGTILGLFVRYFPSQDQTKLPLKRACLVLSICVFAVLGSNHIGAHGAGGLCTLMLTFIGGMSWSKEKIAVQKIIAAAWDVFQPLLFGLVGSEVSVVSLQSNSIGLCIATMSLALLVRISSTFLLMSFARFNFKEKVFIALAWMPKATVQAVLGPLALEEARISAPRLVPYSKDVMTIAFLAILITAPNGALFINILGPKLLTYHDPNKVTPEVTTLGLH